MYASSPTASTSGARCASRGCQRHGGRFGMLDARLGMGRATAMTELSEQIQRHLETLVDTGAETGLQVAVYQDGALIVDAVAGTANGQPITSGTPIFGFSVFKNVTATLAQLLVARGFLGYDSPV